jgi:hypothetical protein
MAKHCLGFISLYFKIKASMCVETGMALASFLGSVEYHLSEYDDLLKDYVLAVYSGHLKHIDISRWATLFVGYPKTMAFILKDAEIGKRWELLTSMVGDYSLWDGDNHGGRMFIHILRQLDGVPFDFTKGKCRGEVEPLIRS